MTGEPNNPELSAGTDNAIPVSEGDTPDSFDFYDPTEDNVEPVQEERTDDETQDSAPEAEIQAEGGEVEPQEETAEQTTEADILDKLVEVDGTQKSVKDLIAGNMMQADYTRGKQEIANQRKSLEADVARIQSISDAIVDNLTGIVPPEPDMRLAATDPVAYNTQKAQYDAAMGMVQKFIDAGDQVKSVTDERSQADHTARMQEENRMLAIALPETATRDGRQAFFNTVADTAEKIGFSREDAMKIDDHRIFLLAHWASKGMAADAARTKAQEKVAKAAQVSVRKPGQPQRQPNRNKDAMRKLDKSGSIYDALAVDFE